MLDFITIRNKEFGDVTTVTIIGSGHRGDHPGSKKDEVTKNS